MARYLIGLYPYKIQTNQVLTEAHILKRKTFCAELMTGITKQSLVTNKIWFSDEAHFWLSGYVNKQNYRYWGTTNPYISISKPLHPQRVTVWAALCSTGIHYHFIEGNVNGAVYDDLLRTKFFPKIKSQRKVEKYWFMQDGATPHRTHQVFETLFGTFGVRVLGLNYQKFAREGLEWPPNSPDLNPLDFFLWGFLKDQGYRCNPKTIAELKTAITTIMNAIKPDMLKRVCDNFVKRIDYCQQSDGSHFENIYM